MKYTIAFNFPTTPSLSDEDGISDMVHGSMDELTDDLDQDVYCDDIQTRGNQVLAILVTEDELTEDDKDHITTVTFEGAVFV